MRYARKYKIYVIIDDNNKFWVVYDNGKLIKNPTKFDLEGAIPLSYNPTNICPLCREEWNLGKITELTEKSILHPRNVCKNIDEKGNKKKDMICTKHWARLYSKYNPNSRWNAVKKPLTDRRMGNQDPDSPNAKGDIGEELTDRLFGTKRLNVLYDKGTLPLDHSCIPQGVVITIGGKLFDLSGMIPQTTLRRFNPKSGRCSFSLEREWNKEFDIEILWCVSEDGLTVDRGYIIPKKKIYDQETKVGLIGITIYKNPKDSWGNPITSVYEQYRITDDDILKKANEIWKDIIKKKKS